jgi:YHS domain-containing protein
MMLLEDLVWLVVLVIVSQMVARIWQRATGPSASRTRGAPRQPTSANPPRSVHMERDPVCGTYVVPERSISVDSGTGRVYFCSAACRDKYRARTA